MGGPSQQPKPSNIRRKAAITVIEMFKDFELLVTDDQQAIDAQYARLETSKMRDRNSADPRIRYLADEWYRTARDLRDPIKRQELLETVYGWFERTSDVALGSSRKKTFDQVTYQRLTEIACNDCQYVPSLAQQVVDRFLQERGILVDGPIYLPRLVENLAAVASPGHIALRWDLPDTNCDGVVIKRVEINRKGSLKPTEKLLGKGGSQQYIDRDIKIGHRYQYRIYSVWQTVDSLDCVKEEAVAIGEISNVSGEWEKDGIQLRWTKPSPGCETFIFRSPQKFSLDSDSPEPNCSDSRVEPVYRGPGSEWRDRNVALWSQYHYLFVAFFGDYAYSPGVAVVKATPIPPPPVSEIWAQYEIGAIQIMWKPVHVANVVIHYILIRTDGKTGALSRGDGRVILETQDTFYSDVNVKNGECYTYTVFACRNDLDSAGCSTVPVVVTQDVENLTAEEGDEAITLRWKMPPRVDHVEVRRSLDLELLSTQSVIVQTTRQTVAHDVGVTNAQIYHYLVRCVYHLDDGEEVFSPGLLKSVTPTRLPDRLLGFSAKKQGERIVCTWQPVSSGTVRVLRTKGPTPFKPDELLPVTRFDQRAYTLPASSRDEAIDPEPTAAEPYYSAFVVAGSTARAGGWLLCVSVDDVSNLKAKNESGGVRLRWTWPDKCRSVMVVRRENDWPDGVNDLQAQQSLYSREEYDRTRSSYFDQMRDAEKSLFYIVYAQPFDAPERVFAPGVSDDCRVHVEPTSFGEMKYQVSIERRNLFGAREFVVRFHFETLPRSFSGFVLVGNTRMQPASREDGVELLHWAPSAPSDVPAGTHECSVSVQDLPKELGNRFYMRMFHLNQADEEPVLIIHPDLGKPLDVH